MNESFPVRWTLLILVAISLVASIGCPPASDPNAADVSHADSKTDSADDLEADDTSSDNDPTDSTSTSPKTALSDTQETDDDSERATSTSVHEKEELFVGWEKPTATLFLTGKQSGYIEPCGCTGLENQKGGLLRRHSLYKQLEEKGWNLIPLDAGNQVRRFGRQPVIKFQRTVQVLAEHLAYQAIGLGPDDLRLDAVEIYSAVLNYQQDELNPFVSGNVKLLGDLLPTHRVVEENGIKVGVTTVLADEYHAEINNSDVEILPALDGLKQVWPEIEAAACDFNVVLVYGSIEFSEQLAKDFPKFDLMLTSGGDGEPTRELQPVEADGHTTQIALTGYKGMHVGVIGLYPGESPAIKYQRVPLDDRFVDSDEIKSIFKEYQNELETLGLSGLEIRPVSHPSGATYVGSSACGECHTTAYDIWENGHDGKGGPHAHATKSLVDPNQRIWVKRHHDPECLSCHVTGWNPQKYFPYEGGYVDLEESSFLHGNGCENCHGPGSKHYAAENGEIDLSDEEMTALRESMRVTKEEARTRVCMECHDLDNSPDFHVEGAWEKYWPAIEHIGLD